MRSIDISRHFELGMIVEHCLCRLSSSSCRRPVFNALNFCHVCKRNLKNLLNSCYIYNKQNYNYSIESALYGVLLTNSQATGGFSAVSQLVNKTPFAVLSMK